MLTTGAWRRLPNRWWVGAAFAFLVLTAALVSYVVVTPIGEQSDEYAHLHYAQLISHNLALPTDGVQERQQPPLYYVLIAAVLKLTGDNPYAARSVSVVLTLATAVLLVATLRVLMPRKPWAALAGLWLFALLPGVQYEGAQVSNDSLAWLAGALAILMLALVIRRAPLSLTHLATVGVTVGVAITSKATVWPLALLLVLALLVRHRRRLRLPQLAAVIAPVLAISGWWFVRNVTTYGRLLPPMTPLTGPAKHTIQTAGQLLSWVSLTWKSAVGVEGPNQTPLVVGPGRAGLYLLTAAGILAAGVVLLATFRAIPSRQGPARSGLWWLIAAPLLAIAFSLVNSFTLDDQPQARYVLVAATVVCGGVAWAFSTLVAGRPRLAALLAGVALIGMVILDAATVQTLRLVT